MSIKQHLQEETKVAMRAKNKARLSVLRFISSTIKQYEIDERSDIDDQRAITILNKLLKQRRDSEKQYREAGRTDLADQEGFEMKIIQEFLPEQLSDAEVDKLIEQTIEATEATGMQAMGQVMAALKPKLQGRADMSAVSQKVKAKLNS